MAVSPNGLMAVSGSDNGFVYVWDIYTGDVKHVLLGHDKPVSSVFISADSKYIITGSAPQEQIMTTQDINDTFASYQGCGPTQEGSPIEVPLSIITSNNPGKAFRSRLALVILII